jgi:mono/diheme cytochrome c family protein
LKASGLIIAVSCWLLVLGEASAQTSQPTASLAANPAYQKNCKKCHGDNAEGRHFGGPSLVSEKTAAMSADNLHGIIANGKGHMPKFSDKLTVADIDAVVQQIEALNKK